MKCTILVVDDDQTTLKLLDRLLNREFTILSASSAEEAMEVLQREKVSILVTDQCMPGMTGTELLRWTQAMDPTIVCMLMTATKDVNTFIEALTHSGAIRVINKPWEPDTVREAIRSAVQKRDKLLRSEQSLAQLKNANEALDRIKNTGHKLHRP